MKTENIQDIYQLSPLQQGILFHCLHTPESAAYFVQQCFALRGNINIDAFEKSWQQVVDKHTALRTAFYWENLEKPHQIVYREVKVSLEQHDWRSLGSSQQRQQLDNFLESERKKGLNFSQAPLMRLILLRVADDGYYFVWNKHHLILDGWSTALVLKQVVEVYQALCLKQNVPLVSTSYGSYISWLQQQDLSQTEVFWRQLLKGIQAPTSLSHLKASRDRRDRAKHQQQIIKLPAETTDKLCSLVRHYGLTLNVLVQGVWAILLSRYSGEQDVIYGMTVSGRPVELPSVESTVGMFINTLPVRVQLHDEDYLLPWLKQLQSQLLEIRQYEYSPLVEIQGWSEIPRNLPLFESIVVFENYPVNEVLEDRQSNLEIHHVTGFEKTNYPLTVTVAPGKELNICISYDSGFNPDTIERTIGYLQTLLEAIAANPQQKLSNLPLLTKPEQHQLLKQWSNTKIKYERQPYIHQSFEAQVKSKPDTIAVVFKDRQLTYRQLNTRANQLAHYLRSLGVKPGVLVGICVERSLETVIGLLGTLKAGGAYVPLDPSFPTQRLAYMLSDSQPEVLLTEQNLLASLPTQKAKIICLDTDWGIIARQSQADLSVKITPDDLAYIIYTSGSTGKPKGVQIPHLALSNFLDSTKREPGLTEEDTLLAVTTYSFDIAALELFLPIIVGARLVIASQEIVADGEKLLAKLTDSQATVMQATPASWKLLLGAGWNGNPRLKVLCGGEALPPHLAHQLLERCDSLWNMYGPTETTIWSAAGAVRTVDGSIPIHSPIANTELYILDRFNRLVPVGVAGELCIGGAGLSRGYLNRPDLTAERFIPHPFSDKLGDRLYRTGDLTKYLAHGEIEYLGRIDRQVKMRGFRIELGEIEVAITTHPKVRESVVAVTEETADLKNLVAYVVTQPEQALTIFQLREFLASKLPSYMIPSVLVTLESLPLTPNGKVDRKALPVPDISRTEADFILPRNSTEKAIAHIYGEILQQEKIGINDSFFELGGHSLLATRVISRIRQSLSIELPLRSLFEYPTVGELADRLLDRTDQEIPKIKPVSRSGNLPLSFAQQRLWFLAQLEPNNPAYNLHTCVHLSGSLNVAALSDSINEIVKRHEVLRTSFTVVDEQPIQKITPISPLTFPIVNLSECPPLKREKEIHRLATQELLQPFDLTQSPLLRMTLVKLDKEEHIVLLTMHHIISDAWSMGVLVEEIAALYPSFCAGKPPTLLELPIQYADFTVWQRQRLQGKILQTQLDYWRQQLYGTCPQLVFSKPPVSSSVKTNRGAKQLFILSKDLTEEINLLSRHEGTTLFMTLLAVFQVLLYCFTGTEDIRVGSPIANRDRVEIEKLIGFFINTLVLRIDLSGNPSFRELLVRSRKVTLEAYANQDLPFEKLVEELQPERNLNQHPLYQAWFVLQNAPMPELELPNLTLTPFKVKGNTVRHDLLLAIWEGSEGLEGKFEYKTDLFDKASISRAIEHFKTLLEHLVAQPDTTLNEMVAMLNKNDEEQRKTQKQELRVAERQKLKMIKRKTIRK